MLYFESKCLFGLLIRASTLGFLIFEVHNRHLFFSDSLCCYNVWMLHNCPQFYNEITRQSMWSIYFQVDHHCSWISSKEKYVFLLWRSNSWEYCTYTVILYFLTSSSRQSMYLRNNSFKIRLMHKNIVFLNENIYLNIHLT